MEREDGGEEDKIGLPEERLAAPPPPPEEMETARGSGRTAEATPPEDADDPAEWTQDPLQWPGPEDGLPEPGEEPETGTVWKLGPVWMVRGAPETEAAQTLVRAAREDGAADAGTAGQPESEAPGLAGLYRRASEAARPAAPALPPERAGRTALEREPGSAASLAVDELDRAVRRDSRRYDGGMDIF